MTSMATTMTAPIAPSGFRHPNLPVAARIPSTVHAAGPWAGARCSPTVAVVGSVDASGFFSGPS
jgi:hypothetical protein